MKKFLFILLSILTLVEVSPVYAVPNKLAVMYGTSGAGGLPSDDDMLCFRKFVSNGGWELDYFNVDSRTWNNGATDTSDAQWFEARYKAIYLIGFDGVAAAIIASGYGTNFQNSGGIARVAYSPVGGRWRIPVYVLAERVQPSTTFNDTTANNYVAGVQHTTPAGSFNKPAEASAGTWRYRVIYKSPTTGIVDTLYCDPRGFACKPSPWVGAGTVNTIMWADTTNGLGSCTGIDTIMCSWRWRPRSNEVDRPGITYCMIRSSYGQLQCTGDLFLLQLIAEETVLKPNRIMRLSIYEHSPEPTSLSSTQISNFRNFYSALDRNNLRRIIAVRTAPHISDIGKYNTETLKIIKDALANRLNVWQPMSNIGQAWSFAFYTSAETLGIRQAYNSMVNCATGDTFGFPKASYNSKSLVSNAGIVGVWMGKVIKDAGADIIETTISIPNVSGWSFQTPPNGRGSTLNPYLLPGGDGRVLYTRGTVGLPEATTFTTLKGGVGDYEYVGLSWVKTIYQAYLENNSLYWHTNAICADDPYIQWLFADVLAKHIKYFNKIIDIDRTFYGQVFIPGTATGQ